MFVQYGLGFNLFVHLNDLRPCRERGSGTDVLFEQTFHSDLATKLLVTPLKTEFNLIHIFDHKVGSSIGYNVVPDEKSSYVNERLL